MADYHNVDAIRSASELLNSTLLAKGFVSHELLFPTIDWSTLTKDQPQKDALGVLETRSSIYNNDKNVINLLYSLTQTLDRHTAQHRALNTTLDQKDKTIEQLRHKISQLELRNQLTEDKLSRTIRVDQVALEERTKQLARQNRAQSYELTRLRNWNNDLQAKFDFELRKRTLEISQLKDKLLDSRNLSTTISYGKPLLSGKTPAGGAPSVNTNLIYDNKPVAKVETQLELIPGGEALSTVVQGEYDGIATQLSELLESLIRENGKYMCFCRELTRFFAALNVEIADLSIPDLLQKTLPDPSELIDLQKVEGLAIQEVDPFAIVSAPLLARVHENYQFLLAIMANLRTATANRHAEENTDEYRRIEDENQNLRDNLKEAMHALEGWKRYKLKRQE